MTINYTSLLALGQPVTGTESGTWGNDVNNAITSYLDIAIAGTLGLVGDGSVTLANTQGTSTATNISASTAQYYIIKVVGPLSVTKVITAPSSSKTYLVINTDSTYGVTVKASGQTGVTVAAGKKALIAFNGTDYAFVAGDDISKLSGTLPVANGGTGLTSGTSGGVPYYSGSTTIASSAALAANALVIGGGAGAAPSTTTTGTGVVTALGTNVGSAGAFVVNGGALGTPSSGTLTNATGLPVGGVSGLGTGVATALAVNTGSAGAFVVNGGALGTPSSGTLTNATGLPVGGISGLGTGVATALAVNVDSTGAFVLYNGKLGTPSSGTLTNATGLPISTGVSGLGTGVGVALGKNVGTTGSLALLGNDVNFGTCKANTQFQAAVGTATAPGYQFGAGSNGIYFTGSNEVAISTSNGLRLAVTSDGRLYGTAIHNNSGSVTGATNQYIASGTYTPSVVSASNLTIDSIRIANWMRAGRVVTVSGLILATAAVANTSAYINLSLPIGSNFASSDQLTGLCFFGAYYPYSGAGGVGGNTGVGIANVSFVPTIASVSLVVYYSFTYVVND